MSSNSISLAAPVASTQDTAATLQYRSKLSSGSDSDWSDWQDSATFSGLTASTSYDFEARYKAGTTASWSDSEASTPVAISTTAAAAVTPTYTASLSTTAQDVKVGDQFDVTMNLGASADNSAVKAFQAGFTYDSTLVKPVSGASSIASAKVTYNGFSSATADLVSFTDYTSTVGTTPTTVATLKFMAIADGTATFAVTNPVIDQSVGVTGTTIETGTNLSVAIAKNSGSIVLVPKSTYNGVPTDYQVLKYTAVAQPADGSAYTYDGKSMYYSSKLSDPASLKYVYLYMVPSSVTSETALASIAETTAASQLAVTYNGDVNGDSAINIVDAQIASDLSAGEFSDGFDLCQMLMRFEADVNGDSTVSAADARAIQYYIHYNTFTIPDSGTSN